MKSKVGVTPPALRYSRASTIKGTRLSQSLLIGISSRAIRLLCVSRRGLAAPDLNLSGVATRGDKMILPQELPIFDTLESLIIRAHFIRD